MPAAAVLLSLLAGAAAAANLDVGAFYRMRALSYSNLNLQEPANNHSFISQNGELSMSVKGIHYASPRGEDQSMDVALAIRGIGIAGSSSPLAAPFIPAGANYPNTTFVPFLEHAYVRVHQLFGRPIEGTFGQQPFTLGSGLLLADDGAGLAGAHVIGTLPWWNMKASGFVFQPRNSQASPNSLMAYGFAVELPTEGTWQINQLVEKDKTLQQTTGGVPVNKATRYFTSVRYQLSYGPFVFDGEAAIERGSAVPACPSAANPTCTRVTYNGNAQALKAKWRQSLWKGGDGIARLVVSRGSGDSGASTTTDEAFFPSHGHRYDGLERAGLGDFFGATPYDAFGGQSTATLSGLPQGASGVQTVGLGLTPPAYKGVSVDFDYFLFQADRNVGSHRTLGTEIDVRLRYNIKDKLTFQATGAFFTVGPAISPNKGGARRYMFEAMGRF